MRRMRPECPRPWTLGTLRDASTPTASRLGAGRSLVQIQPPRFSHPAAAGTATSGVGAGANEVPIVRRRDAPTGSARSIVMAELREARPQLCQTALVGGVDPDAGEAVGEAQDSARSDRGDRARRGAGARAQGAQPGHAPNRGGDVARYILPPGNYGGLPTTENSTDQLPLYAGLTPLRDNVTDADIERFFLPEDFQPIGATHEEETGRPGLRLIYDAYGIPHVYGETRADVAFGAGWVTARDRGLLIQLGRGPARVAVADVPNINAFVARHERPVVRAERRGRGARHGAAPAPGRHLRRRGPADPRRRPGLRGRHQRLLEGATASTSRRRPSTT